MPRASTWTNSDGLVVGYGPRTPEFAGSVTKQTHGAAKFAAASFDWKNLNAGHAINVPIPAGSRVLAVKIRVVEGFTSTGTNTITVGDGSDADGFITATAATTVTMATAGNVILPDGVYAFGATDTGAAELKAYAAADTIDLATGMTDWTAGKGVLEVSYV